MNELIKIQEHDGKQLVDARELHEKLQVDTRFNDWINRQIERARLLENVHYVILLKNEFNSKGRPQKECALTIDGAIHIASMNGGEIGFELRDHLINFRKNPLNFLSKSRLFEMALDSEKEKERLQALSTEQQRQIETMKPTVDFVETIFKPSTICRKIGEFAKTVSLTFPDGKIIGPNQMFELLRGMGILMWGNQPKAEYIKAGYFELKENIDKEKNIAFSPTTLITTKGQDWLYKKIPKFLAREEYANKN